MNCSHLVVNGLPVIVCGRPRVKGCVTCGAPAGRMCDWKVTRDRTCDKPICVDHTCSPAPGKDLCPAHAKRWADHPKNVSVSA